MIRRAAPVALYTVILAALVAGYLWVLLRYAGIDG